MNACFLISESGSTQDPHSYVLHKVYVNHTELSLINSNQICEREILIFRIRLLINVGIPSEIHSFQSIPTCICKNLLHPTQSLFLIQYILTSKYTSHQNSLIKPILTYPDSRPTYMNVSRRYHRSI